MRFAISAALMLALSAPTAHAQFFEDLFQGFQTAGTPISGPLFTGPGGGQAGGARLGRTRIVPNRLGDGWRFEFDRNFGPDQLGRPEVYNLGNLELELAGQTDVTAEITRRGIPTATLDFNISNLNYAIRGLTGLEDVEIVGTFDLANDIRINPLGFYTYSLTVNNTNAEIRFDGLLADGELDTDFDIGPINVKGNLFFDAFVALLGSFGVDTSELVGVFPDSPIDRIVEEIQTSLAKQAGALTQQLRLDGGLTLGEVVESGTGASLFGPDFSVEFEVYGANDTAPFATPVPEPATLLLLSLMGLVAARRR